MENQLRIGRIVAASAVMAASVALLSACVSAPSTVVHESRVTVASEDVFTLLNPLTESGAGSTNTAVAYATNAGFTYYTDAPELATDESFGTYRVITDDPLTVRYTVADGVRWSDGTAVDAADLLLSWAAALVGVEVPINLVLFVSVAVLFLVCIQHSVELTSLESKTRDLAEQSALQDLRIRELEQRLDHREP
jgi:ABC-type transport system substrate-binding protein